MALNQVAAFAADLLGRCGLTTSECWVGKGDTLLFQNFYALILEVIAPGYDQRMSTTTNRKARRQQPTGFLLVQWRRRESNPQLRRE